MKSLFNRTDFFFLIIIGLRKNPEAVIGRAKKRLTSLWGVKYSSHGLHHQQLLDLSSSHQEHGEIGAQTTHNQNQEYGEAGTQSTNRVTNQSDKIWQGSSIPTARKSTLLSGPDIRMISPLLELLRVLQAHLEVYNGGQDKHYITVCLTHSVSGCHRYQNFTFEREKKTMTSQSSTETGTTWI